MNITDIQITQMQLDRIRAIVSITLDDALVINGIRIIEGSQGLDVEMPRRKPSGDGIRYVAHPITNKAWDELTKSIIHEFEKTSRGEFFEGHRCND
ncbi:septation protein SpoVG family protein [Heliobacterium chlorum]|uniref:Septation protein SpoVG family protein n=1 Tax=Heliobacterium chlorum TaxID=2698 RepID=A0ABR7SWG6_HELCL|nr:SpoVG family protein [Heliobacterium chlorum]MBC9782894.1 septation protein SpoVG family protein [Heliobacterium chlorum]